MTKAQIASVLSSLGESQDSMINFEGSGLNYINFTKYENRFVMPADLNNQLLFKFNSTTEMVEVYPCQIREGKPIKYLIDENGKKICDYYSYESVKHFVFKEVNND